MPAVFRTGEGGSAIRRARPVADLPLDALLARSGEAARRWAIALVSARPLDAIGEIPLEAIAIGGPGLCEQMLRALASDAALDSLLAGAGPQSSGVPEMPARLAAVSGSGRPGLLVAAAEALRGALWELLLEELPGAAADPAALRRLGDVSDRLAQLCAALLAAALEPAESQGPPPRRERAAEPHREGPQWAGPAGRDRDARQHTDADAASEPPIVIVDEQRAAYASIERPPFRARVAAEGVAPGRERPDLGHLDALSAAVHAADMQSVAMEGPAAAQPEPGALDAPGAEIATQAEISIRDERGDAGPGAWVGSIGRELRRHERDGEPFAVLLVEARADPTGRAGHAEEPIEQVLAGELRASGGILTRERAGRWWALAPRTDRVGAQALAARLQQMIDAISTRGDAPSSAAIGLAVCPEDGLQAAALAAHADVSLYAARAENARAAHSPRGAAG